LIENGDLVALRDKGGKSGLHRIECPPVMGGGIVEIAVDGKCNRKYTAPPSLYSKVKTKSKVMAG
jgi:hypothetical protein